MLLYSDAYLKSIFNVVAIISIEKPRKEQLYSDVYFHRRRNVRKDVLFMMKGSETVNRNQFCPIAAPS